jgi:catechol 2,3-dioxygenase-like lactoylglutathione lyase family enzyme
VIRDIVHININVTDIERSLAFYQRLGFQLMHVLGDEPTDDVTAGATFGYSRMRGAVLTLGEHPRCWTKIELIQWVEPPTEPAPERGQIHAGVSRIALRCKNLLEFYESLRADGVEFESEPHEIDIVGAKRFVLFRDPDGTLLELIEF